MLVHIGKIVNTHGIGGEVKMLYYADSPDVLSDIACFIIDHKEYNISHLRPHKNSLIVKLECVDDIDSAVGLKNKQVHVRRDQLPPLPHGRYYIADLLGLSVICNDGRDLGKIADVITTGANEVYMVRSKDGGEHLIPAIDDVINETNIEGGYVKITPLKGLLDSDES